MYTNLNYILGEEFANAINKKDEKTICSKILGLETVVDNFSALKPFDVLAAIHEIRAIEAGILNLRNMWEWDIHQNGPLNGLEKTEAVITYNKHVETLSVAHSFLMYAYNEIRE